MAKQASQRLRKRLGKGGRVEVIQNDRRLSHHVVPMRMTAARVGAVAGGIIVGGLSLLAVTAWLNYAVEEQGRVLAIGETLALTLLLATMLGAMAGALCFASDATAVVQRLRGWLRRGKTVLIVDDPRLHEETLRACGAKIVGRVR
ncbi:MAG: hypothetical protein KC457_13760 [Myxococcales bacterium]|nr:hypothetical protein [Myxococcales bacterium]